MASYGKRCWFKSNRHKPSYIKVEIMGFIRIKDKWGRVYNLNVYHILAVKEFEVIDDEYYAGVKTVIEYGSGYIYEVYLTEDVDEVMSLILK
jgi:hypothetical protein